MFKRILVAVDGSDAALRAVEHAVALQQKFDSDLLILCVYRHHSLLDASMWMVRPEAPENLEDSMREHATGVVESAKAYAAKCGASRVRGFIKAGPPARTIIGFAKDKQVDVIVLGSRGTGDASSYLLGSVSHKVTSLSDCPTLVV